LTLSEAERKARRELYEFAVNSELLEHKELLSEVIRERGSRVTQKYEELPGKASARYVESVPLWLLEAESAEHAIFQLIDAVTIVRGLLNFAQERRPELYELYAAKYRDGLPLPELKKRFGAKLDKLDRELVFSLIHWHGWRIDDDSGGAFRRWMERCRG
jgi:hypothetical protein